MVTGVQANSHRALAQWFLPLRDAVFMLPEVFLIESLTYSVNNKAARQGLDLHRRLLLVGLTARLRLPIYLVWSQTSVAFDLHTEPFKNSGVDLCTVDCLKKTPLSLV